MGKRIIRIFFVHCWPFDIIYHRFFDWKGVPEQPFTPLQRPGLHHFSSRTNFPGGFTNFYSPDSRCNNKRRTYQRQQPGRNRQKTRLFQRWKQLLPHQHNRPQQYHLHLPAPLKVILNAALLYKPAQCSWQSPRIRMPG